LRANVSAAFVAMSSMMGGGKHSAPLTPAVTDSLPPATLTFYSCR
jgi:hypothetical protein